MAIDVEVSRAKMSGAQEVEGFEGVVRSVGGSAFKQGDVFTFPDTLVKMREPIEGSKDKDGNQVYSQYTFVDMANGSTRRFYTGTFTRWYFAVAKAADGTYRSTGQRLQPSGEAIDLFRKYASVNEAMDALAGKTVKVSAVTPVEIFKYGSTVETVKTECPVFDLVEE